MDETPANRPDSGATERVTGGLPPPVAAGIACIFTIISGVIFLILEKKNRFVRFWAMQAILLGLVSITAAIFFAIAHYILGQMPLIGGLMNFALGLLQWAFQIAWFVVYVVCIVKSFCHQEWEIPWLGCLARRFLAQTDKQIASQPTGGDSERR